MRTVVDGVGAGRKYLAGPQSGPALLSSTVLQSGAALLSGVALLFCAALVAPAAQAIPALQLSIADGFYRASDETIISFSEDFSLDVYANGNNWSANSGDNNYIEDQQFWLSIALENHGGGPVAEVDGGAFGSFTIDDGTGDETIAVTADMFWGMPAIEDSSSDHDSTPEDGNLPGHGVFPTYFVERSFTMRAGDRYQLADTNPALAAGDAAITPLAHASGPGMFYKTFQIDTTNLNLNYEIHFDAFTRKVHDDDDHEAEDSDHEKDHSDHNDSHSSHDDDHDHDVFDDDGEVEIDLFAPFSHDAASWPNDPSPIPEPGTLTLFGLGLLGLGALRRRRRAAGGAVT